MTITIDPFWCGVLATILAEFLAFVLMTIFYAIKNSVKTRRNTSNFDRSNKNE